MGTQVVGFIGQGFIGRHMADDFEHRGYQTVRYALEESYVHNKDKIKNCSITFIAVPTPTTTNGFDASIVRSALKLIGKGNVAVIKSTILPGTTNQLQEDFPDIVVMHSPEFLREKSAAEDTAHPERNLVGVPKDTDEYKDLAKEVMELLPKASYSVITSALNAECIKYIGNAFLYTKLLFMNIMHDFVEGVGADWEAVRDAVGRDSRIGHSHTSVVHDSGRGAGGHCFIKDFEALLQHFSQHVNDSKGLAALEALRNKNNQLLLDTNKDLDLLYGVYGDDVPVVCI